MTGFWAAIAALFGGGKGTAKLPDFPAISPEVQMPSPTAFKPVPVSAVGDDPLAIAAPMVAEFEGFRAAPKGGVISRTLTTADYERAAKALGTDARTIRAVVQIESSGFPFQSDGRPVIRFEAHIFDRLTSGKHRDLRDKRGAAISVAKADHALAGPAGAHQWDRMRLAAKRDRDAAWKAASWGAPQIMGFNHTLCGFPTVEKFVQAMESGAGAQLDAMAAFIRANPPMATALRRHDWATFARHYNGSDYARLGYDTKLAAAWKTLA